MASGLVEDILREIEALSEEQRLVLDRGLAAQLQREWEREAGAARDEARRRGVDQAAIDRAVERQRYGR